MEITEWSMVADTRAANPDRVNLKDNAVSTPLSRVFASVVSLNACLEHAYRVERQAKHLYAMSHKDLDQIGISREDIPAHLAKTFTA